MKVIEVQKILGKEIRSRASICAIKERMQNKGEVCLDMKDITFISRSFADELYNLQYDYKQVHFCNQSEEVSKMMLVVWEGRKKKRERKADHTVIQDMTSIDKFVDFLQTI